MIFRSREVLLDQKSYSVEAVTKMLWSSSLRPDHLCKYMARLSIRPTFHFHHRQKEAPDENSFSSPREIFIGRNVSGLRTRREE